MINIVMCTYNGEKYIKEQLESIAGGTVDDWKLFIFDDQSTDRTVKIAEGFKEKYAEKTVVSININKKGAIANFLDGIREIGSKMTGDDVVMLCDQDDIWNPDKIQRTMDGMAELVSVHGNKIPLLVCTDVAVADDDMRTINESFRKMNNYSIKKLDFPHLMMENKVQGCTVMINKNMAEMMYRLPQKAAMHDGWLALIAAAFGRIKYIDEPTMKYRQHAGNVRGSIGYKDDIRNKFLHLGGQRKIVMDTTGQVAEFLDIYGDRLPQDIKDTAQAFATLPRQNFFARRYNIIRYHMWKSGVLRNIGLMVLI